MVAPEWKTRVGGKGKEDALILKEKRKAREERNLARKDGAPSAQGNKNR